MKNIMSYCNPNLKFSMVTQEHHCSDCHFSWYEIQNMLKEVFNIGGQADFYTLTSELLYYIRMSIVVIDRKYKIYIHTNDADNKKRLLEWWNPQEKLFKGFEVFDYIENIQEEDSRTIGSDLNLAIKIFKDFFDNSQPSKNTLLDFRSIWEPKQ